MKKILTVNGMNCNHCASSVKNALEGINGIEKAKVELEKKTATVFFKGEISDQTIIKAVTDSGFEVTEIKTVKGLFG